MILTLTGGCYIASLRMHVAPDGSGKLALLLIYKNSEISKCEIPVEGDDKKPAVPHYTFEDKERLEAFGHSFGSGITLDRIVPYSNGVARGAVVVYSFTNITNIFIPVEDGALMSCTHVFSNPSFYDGEDKLFDGNCSNSISFRFISGTSNQLDIVLPDIISAKESNDSDVSIGARNIDKTEHGIHLGDASYMMNLENGRTGRFRPGSKLHMDVRVEIDGQMTGYRGTGENMMTSNGVTLVSYSGFMMMNYIRSYLYNPQADDFAICSGMLRYHPPGVSFVTNNITLYFR